MYFPVNSEWFDTVEGISFCSKYGAIGSHILIHLHRFIAKAPDGYLPTTSLNAFAEIVNVELETCIEVVIELVESRLIAFSETPLALTTIDIQTSNQNLQKKKQVFEKNRKTRSSQMSVQTSVQTSSVSISEVVSEVVKKDPNKKLYLDAVLLTDEEFATVEKRYAKDGLTKRDVQRAIELLNGWFLRNPQKRLERTSDNRALITWPLREVIKEAAERSRLATAQTYQAKATNGPGPPNGVVKNATPPRGFDLAKHSGEKSEAPNG